MSAPRIPVRRLPRQPSLEQLRKQAKELMSGWPGFTLSEAQRELARTYGFASWPKLKAFVDGANVERLAEAVNAGDLATVRKLLKARPELVAMERAGNDEHEMLLARIDPNVARRGATVLHFVAARQGLSEGARVRFPAMLLDHGARLDLRDELLLSTPLGWACRWGRREMAELLLARGASPNEPEAEPWATPLAWAHKMGHAEIVAMLRART